MCWFFFIPPNNICSHIIIEFQYKRPFLNLSIQTDFLKINIAIKLCQGLSLVFTSFVGRYQWPVVIDNIKSKCGTFDWLMAKYWVGCLQEAFNVYNTFLINSGVHDMDVYIYFWYQKTHSCVFNLLLWWNYDKSFWKLQADNYFRVKVWVKRNSVHFFVAITHPSPPFLSL